MNIAQPFIARPVMTTLVMFAILLFGAIGYKNLPISNLPNVDFPTIQVTSQLPGASAETMASAVSIPLEKQFATIAGLIQMTSTSTLGQSQITLAIRYQPQHGRSSSGRPGVDHSRLKTVATTDDDSADFFQGQSGGPTRSYT